MVHGQPPCSSDGKESRDLPGVIGQDALILRSLEVEMDSFPRMFLSPRF